MSTSRSVKHVSKLLLAPALILCVPHLALAAHKSGHTSQGAGQVDLQQYNCGDLGATECMLAKLDRIERRMGCPIEDYLDGSCPYSPADTTATFCISQGREGGIDAEWGAEANADYDLGVGWPNVGWAKAIGKVEHPVVLPLGPIPIPVPTELNITGAASLGRNFDICIEVPLIPSETPGPLEPNSDAEVIDRVVRTINEPQSFAKSKFQRRLGRLANYAIFRVPGTNRFGSASAGTQTSELAVRMGDDGESEFDVIEEAIERMMSGDWQIPADGGPTAVLRSPFLNDLRSVLELPNPVQSVLDDPDQLVARMFELRSSIVGGAGLADSERCAALGLPADLQDRFESVAKFCGQLGQLPQFSETVGIFGVVASIRSIVGRLPTLAEIKGAACDIAGWNCDDE